MSSLDLRPAGIITGFLGVGKTSETARAFQNYRWLLSRPTALVTFEHWLTTPEGQKSGLAVPEHRTIHEIDGETLKRVDVYKALTKEIVDFAREKRTGKTDRTGIVLDEASSLFTPMFGDIKANYGSRNRMNYDASDEFKEQVSWIVKAARAADFGLVMIMHRREAVMETKEGTDASGRAIRIETGRMKYKGGPQFPIGTQIDDVCKDLDFVWEMTLGGGLGGGARVMLTQPSPDFVRKTARAGGAAKFPLSPQHGLREELLKLNYRID